MIVSKLAPCPSRISSLGHAQHIRRLAADAPGKVAGCIHQFVRRNHARDQAPGRGRGGVDRIGGEEELRGACHADRARQDPRPAVARHQTHLEKGGAEDRALRRDAHVGETGDIIAEPDGRTVDRGDHRHLDAPHRLDETMDAIAVALADVHGGSGKGARARAHRLQIAAGGKGLARAGQNDATDVAVLVDAPGRIGEQLAIAVLAERIAALGPVDRERGYGAGFLEQKCGHLASGKE